MTEEITTPAGQKYTPPEGLPMPTEEAALPAIRNAGLTLFRKLAALRPLLPAPKRTGWNEHFKSHYASLGGVYDAIEPLLAQHKLHLQQTAQPCEKGIRIVTALICLETGELLEQQMDLPMSKNDPQGAGSAFTYARRYGIQVILGLRTHDDDGEAATRGRPAKGGSTSAKVQSRISPDVGMAAAKSSSSLPDGWEFPIWIGRMREAQTLQELAEISAEGGRAGLSNDERGEASDVLEASRRRLGYYDNRTEH